MKQLLRTSFALAALTLAAHASAQLTFYERESFAGRSFVADQQMPNLARSGFNDRASSAVVSGGSWEVCEDARFGGRCVTLRPGRYATLASTGLNDRISSVRPLDVVANDRRPSPPPVDGITFYDQERFGGRSFTTAEPLNNFERQGFNDRASSVVVTGGSWEVCSDPRFGGRCTVLRPGEYPTLTAMNMDERISSVRRLENSAPIAVAPSATFFERENYRGLSFTTDRQVGNFDRQGFNGRAESANVVGGRWEVCEDPRFGGKCMYLQPGSYPSLSTMGLRDRIASVREVTEGQVVGAVDTRPVPPAPLYDARRRGEERLYQADVVSVKEVVGTPEQRCWVERQPVANSQATGANVPAALVGAVLGGILGHQVGGGTGKDIATAVGIFGGAVAGANIKGGGANTQEVQRCDNNVLNATPSYWDVTYTFRGLDHRVQMATPPQATLTVNEQGEPRI